MELSDVFVKYSAGQWVFRSASLQVFDSLSRAVLRSENLVEQWKGEIVVIRVWVVRVF